jgi:hypothetical protein
MDRQRPRDVGLCVAVLLDRNGLAWGVNAARSLPSHASVDGPHSSLGFALARSGASRIGKVDPGHGSLPSDGELGTHDRSP